MAPVPKNSIEHFTHPGHGLVLCLSNVGTDYLCAGCKTPGKGARFRCDACDFDLHEYCATCPIRLSSFMHSHALSLVVRKAQATRQNERVCNLCGDHVEGLFYRCKGCEFDVHPLCTQLPQTLRHALHPVHPLTLQASASSRCAVCGSACTSWRYRCGGCGFDIHLECVLVACDHAPPNQPSVPPPFVPPPPPPYRGYGHSVPSGFSPFGVPPPSPPPPPYGGYGYGVPSGSVSYNNYANKANGGGETNGRIGKTMFALVGKLGLGVLSNVIFGMSNIDFSSFM